MVHDVAGEQSRLGAGLDLHAQMPGTVSWRGDHADLLTDPLIIGNEVDKAGVDDWLNRVLEHQCLRWMVATLPVLELDALHQIARPRKCRHPAAGNEPCVPADVVDMQMRGKHRID